MTSIGGKKLISNAGALFALQLANYLLPFLIIPFLTRTLGVSLYGVVAFGLALVQIACIVTDFGFNLSATRQIASHSDDREFIRKVIGAVHVCKFFLLVPIGLLFLVFIFSQEQKYGEHASFFFLLLMPVVGQTFQPIWFFQGIERMGFITVFLVLARSSYVVLAILWVSVPEDYVWVAIANGVAQILGALVAVGFMVRLGYAPIWPDWPFVRRIFTESVEFFWSRAAVATYTAGGVFFMGIVYTPINVAYYSAAEQLYKGAQALLQPLTQALYPYMVKRKDVMIFFRVFTVVTLLALVGCGIGLVTGNWFLVLIFGEDFSQSYPLLCIFLIAFCVVAPSVLLGYPFLGAFGDSKSANRSVIIGGGIQVVVLTFLYLSGITEGLVVALSVLLVEVFVLSYRVIKARDILKYCSQSQ